MHHLIVASVGAADVAAIERRDAEDDGAGFDCSGGLGEFPTATPLGGSLLGGDYPRGIGSVVLPGSRILLQIHYSASSDDPPADQTSLDFRLDTTAVVARSIVVGNAAWVVGEAMRVPAGEEDVGFWYRFQPLLFTGGKPVDLQGVTPHGATVPLLVGFDVGKSQFVFGPRAVGWYVGSYGQAPLWTGAVGGGVGWSIRLGRAELFPEVVWMYSPIQFAGAIHTPERTGAEAFHAALGFAWHPIRR